MIYLRTILLIIACAGGIAVAQSTQPARQVDLLAMGDWGSGSANQKAVAVALAGFAQKQNPAILGMLLAGDNFYNDLSGIDDPEWQSRFEKMYDPVALNFPFYAALGNHDYLKDKWKIELEYARVHPESRFKLPSRWYRIEFPQDDPLVTVLMLDSDKALMGDAAWQEEKQWITDQLNQPRTSKWIMAVAHHPLFSNGAHGDNGVLQKEWGPLFAEHKLDLYVCGHDHDVQHLEIPGCSTSFVLCGGGGANVREMVVDQRGPFSKRTFGFAHLLFTEDEVRVRLVNQEQKPLHEFVRDHEGNVQTVFTTPSDAAKSRTPRSIAGDDDAGRKAPATAQTK